MKEIFDISQIEAIACDIEEQETSINLSRDSDLVKIYTSDRTVLTKLSKLFNMNKDCWKCFECSRNNEGKVTGYLFTTNKKAIVFKSGKKKKLSEETKIKARERIKKARQNMI